MSLSTDVQNDFCAGGAREVSDADAVIPLIHRIGPLFRHLILTQDWHPPAALARRNTPACKLNWISSRLNSSNQKQPVLLRPQRIHGVDRRGPAGGNIARDSRRDQKHEREHDVGQRIERAHVEQNGRQKPHGGKRYGEARACSDQGEGKPLANK
jgi:nicotinamidase-related amidase